MNNPKFVIRRSVNGQFFFNLQARNGEKILTSETYSTNASARAGIESVRINSQNDSRYQRFDAVGNYRFVLKAANGEIIGRSENYSTSHNREVGISAVKADAPVAGIEDLS